MGQQAGSLFFKNVLFGTISKKSKTGAVYDKKRQVNISVKVLVVIHRLFKPAPKFFEKLAVLVILELRIPPP